MDKNKETTIRLTENFPASKETLSNAWTEPGQLKQWWKPMNRQLIDVQNDLREGGKVVYHFTEGLTINGNYQQVREGDLLVYTWIWNLPEEAVHKGDYLLTIKFSGDAHKSTLDVTRENFRNEHAIQPHEEGWRESLKDLKNYLQNRIGTEGHKLNG